jgi:7-cyano-7-deazaguanine synthase
MSKVVVSLSGGLDSTTVLGLAKAQGHEIQTVGFCYGSKHNKYENKAAVNIASHYQVPYRLIDFSSAAKGFKSNLMADGGAIPEGHYEAASMTQTVVPGRNIIFSSILAGFAWSFEYDEIWLGVHAGDHFIYPDCRPSFFVAMKTAVEEGTDKKVTMRAPFLMVDKVEIVRQGLVLKVPYLLTRTCYKDQSYACGRCGSCQERLTAFGRNGAEDPIAYEGGRTLISK